MAFLIGMPFYSTGQNFKVSGTIKDSLNNPIPGVVISASSIINKNEIIAYSTSSNKGFYEIAIANNKTKIILLTYRHISFETKEIQVPTTIKSEKNIILQPKVEKLKEVLLESPKRVEIKGDTIIYDVQRIKAKKDYSVEDVISRIPGVTISETGQIKYKDKAISHLYINGVDLLEGKYNIATQGIPADAVKSIEVLQNHNHERIDIGRTESNKVAFNLNIKEDQSLVFGSLKSDIGVPLATGLLEGTPIYLKDKFQDIGSFKLNNFGKSLKENGSGLTVGDGDIENLKLKNSQIIRPPNTNGGILSDKFWLDNDSYAITNNALHKISDSTLLKWSINYNNELSKIENSSETTFIVNNDSSLVANNSRNQLRLERAQAGITQEVNKRDFYIKNNTNLHYNKNNGFNKSVLNQDSISSTYSDKTISLVNQTNLKTLIGKNNILNSGLLIEYSNKSEQLNVIPAIFDSFFDNNEVSESTLQTIDIVKFNLGMFSNYTFNWLKIKWKFQQIINYKKFNFNSRLSQLPNNTELAFPFASNFDYSQLSTSSKLNTKLNIGNMRLSGSVSADLNNINTQENETANPVKQNEFFFFLQPFFSARYKFNSKWSSGINYSTFNSVSNFAQLYQPFILKSFNLIIQNPEVINITKSQSANQFLSYGNILNSFYFILRGQWQQTTSNVTFASQLNNDGFIITEVIERPNFNKNYGFSLNLTKGFLGSFNTDFGYRFNISENELFFNNEFLNAVNKRHSFDLKLAIDNGTWYSFQYDAKLNLSTSELPNNEIDNSFLFQTATLDFYTSEKTRLNFGLETVRTASSNNNSINNNTMLNLGFFYKPSKKIFLRANLLNIFNTSFFSTINNSLNTVNVSQFSLRPRQFTIGLNYSL